MPRLSKSPLSAKPPTGDPAYALAKLREAVRALATDPRGAVERLLVARRTFNRMRSEDFPPAERDEFEAIVAEIDE